MPTSDRWRIFNICLLTILLLVVTLAHYNRFLVGIPVLTNFSTPWLVSPTAYSIERLLYILLAAYAKWFLGTRAGVGTWLASAAAMLPQALIVAVEPRIDITESAAAVIISGLAISLIQIRRRWYRQQKRLRGVTEALRTSQENYEELFTNASDAIWVHDLDGKIIIANNACEKLTGYPPNKLVGKNVIDFMSPEALNIAKEVKSRLIQGEALDQRYDQRLIRKDGSGAIVELFTRLIKDNGKPRAFQNIARDVTEERRLRDNLRLQIHKTLMAQEEERKRIARELHDDIAQSVLLLSRKLDILISGSDHKMPKAIISELERIQNMANDVYQSVQRYARDLRPSILDQMGLIAALNWLADELNKDLGIKTEVKANTLPLLPSETELTMFRIAQEALNNIRKHSQASEVKISVESTSRNIRMTVVDNGIGFSLSSLNVNLAKEGKLGVLGMSERARLIGGSLQIQSEPDKGTKVIAEAPMV